MSGNLPYALNEGVVRARRVFNVIFGARPLRVNAWRVLVAGFGGLLILMTLAGVDSLSVLREVRRSNVDIRKTYLLRNRELEQIRSGIYLSGTAVRDYLLSTNLADASEQRAHFRSLQLQTDRALTTYAGTLDPSETGAFRNLQSEIQTYWRLLELIFDPTREASRTHGSSYFYNQLVLRRTAMLELADRISAVNDRELTAGDDKAAQIFERFRLRQLAIFFISIAGGLILSALSIVYMLRLEQQAQARYQESVRAQTQLKELSAKLVAAQEEERRAISRELHDEVGQSLSALLMEAGAAAASAPPEAEDTKQRLESIKELAESSVNVLRNMALLLRPSMLDDLGSYRRCGGRRARFPSAPGSGSGCRRITSPRTCRTSTKPASIAWCRRRCTTASGTPRRMPFECKCRRAMKGSNSAFRTMASASMRAKSAGWGCWEWRSACNMSEGASRWSLSQEREPC